MGNTTAVILAAVTVAGGMHLAILLKDKGRGRHLVAPAVGTLLLGALLMLIAEVWPVGARGLALVILLTAVVMNGGKFFQLLTSLVD